MTTDVFRVVGLCDCADRLKIQLQLSHLLPVHVNETQRTGPPPL